MAHLRSLLGIAIVLSFSCGCVMAQDEASSMASKIIALEKSWNQAFNLRDGKALATLLADNVVLINDDGSMQSKQEFIAWMRAAKQSDGEQVSPQSITVRFSGEVAVAKGTFVVKGTAGGKPHERIDRFADTWVFSRGAWTCVSATATRVGR